MTEVAPGDHVLPIFTGECKECAHCKSQDSNMCDLLRINTERGVMISDGQSRFSINGTPIYNFLGTSTFSEYTVVHVGCIAKINPLAPLEKVCVVSCGVSTGEQLCNLINLLQHLMLWSLSNFCRLWCHCQCCKAKERFNSGCLWPWSLGLAVSLPPLTIAP